jgi:hypothetical protein
MRSAVADALETAAGPGWRLIPVGGGARDVRSHDCDFVVTHDSNKCGLGVLTCQQELATVLTSCSYPWRQSDVCVCQCVITSVLSAAPAGRNSSHASAYGAGPRRAW